MFYTQLHVMTLLTLGADVQRAFMVSDYSDTVSLNVPMASM